MPLSTFLVMVRSDDSAADERECYNLSQNRLSVLGIPQTLIRFIPLHQKFPPDICNFHDSDIKAAHRSGQHLVCFPLTLALIAHVQWQLVPNWISANESIANSQNGRPQVCRRTPEEEAVRCDALPSASTLLGSTLRHSTRPAVDEILPPVPRSMLPRQLHRTRRPLRLAGTLRFRAPRGCGWRAGGFSSLLYTR